MLNTIKMWFIYLLAYEDLLNREIPEGEDENRWDLIEKCWI